MVVWEDRGVLKPPKPPIVHATDIYTAAYQRIPHWLVYLQHMLLYYVQVQSSKGQCDASTRNGVARKHSSHIRIVTITEDHSWIADSGSINGNHHQSSGGEVCC